MADNKSNSVLNYSRGITFSKHIPKKISPFERVFEIFKDLLTHTSGNLDETFRWLDILDKEYNIFTDEYTLEKPKRSLNHLKKPISNSCLVCLKCQTYYYK